MWRSVKVTEWIVFVCGCLIILILNLFVEPFQREIHFGDPSLSYPFSKETIPPYLLYVRKQKQNKNKDKTKNKKKKQKNKKTKKQKNNKTIKQ